MRANGVILPVLVVWAASALAAPPAAKKAPATAPAARKPPAAAPAVDPAAMTVTVVSVSGPAQKLLVGEGKRRWQALKAGEQLSEMTVIRTGLGARVVLRFADRGEVTVNNATKVGIGELRRRGTEVRARLGLKYGTMRASVESGRGRNDFRISTPVATLSVRGSVADVGFMVDSPNIIQTIANAWELLQTIPVVDAQPQIGPRVVLAGEWANSSSQTPISIALRNQTTQLFDSFGVTYTEQQTLIQNHTGNRANNTPSGGGTRTTNVSPSTIVLPKEPDDSWPWPPWP